MSLLKPAVTEDEMQVDEVVDPLQMWKDLKKQEAHKENVKVY